LHQTILDPIDNAIAMVSEPNFVTASEPNFVMASEPNREIAQFRRISIPLVRRIYPRLIADTIVSVQPLSGPTGLVNYLRHRYQTSGFSLPIEIRFGEKSTVDWKTEGF